MRNLPKISLITPVYNVAEFLRECLDSLANQTLKEVEFICINDGSTDGSLDILNEYASKDDRFVIISQENQGQGVAKNKGIELARGEYIIFVDPDDWIDLDTFEVLYNKFLETGVDIIQFDYDIHYEAGRYHKTRSYGKNLRKYLNYSIKTNDTYNWRNISKGQFSHISLLACDKAYKLDFLKKNNIKFAPNRHSEDNIFSIAANLLANKILYLNRSFYHYRTRLGSATNKVSDDSFCVFDNVELIKEFLISNNLFRGFEKDFEDYLVSAFASQYPYIPEQSIERYLNMCKETMSEKEHKKFLREIKGDLSFIEQIFSIKNRRIYGVKCKVITVLGTSFKIKHPKS